jgi:phage baseplate assembly protein W
MPSEISIPFRLGPDNKLAAESDPNAQIRQHVNSLINTEPGERVVLGNYGVPLSEMLFEGDDEVVAGDLASDIADAMATFEPGVGIRQIARVPGPDGDGLSVVSVQYLRTDSPTTSIAASRSQNVAVISASGKVSEVIRG